jgi:hypothetical protein
MSLTLSSACTVQLNFIQLKKISDILQLNVLDKDCYNEKKSIYNKTVQNILRIKIL